MTEDELLVRFRELSSQMRDLERALEARVGS
jgi:hypothetical protein